MYQQDKMTNKDSLQLIECCEEGPVGAVWSVWRRLPVAVWLACDTRTRGGISKPNLYQTITRYFLFGRFKATLRMSELEFLWVSFRGLPVDCLLCN